MTRFARAKGSKASNERLPEEATPWSEIKSQLHQKNKENDENKKRQEVNDSRNAKYKAFLEEMEENESKKSSWADFPEVRTLGKQGKSKIKTKLKKVNKPNLVSKSNQLAENDDFYEETDDKFDMLKTKVDKILNNMNGMEQNKGGNNNTERVGNNIKEKEQISLEIGKVIDDNQADIDSDTPPDEESAKKETIIPAVKVRKLKQKKLKIAIPISKRKIKVEDNREDKPKKEKNIGNQRWGKCKEEIEKRNNVESDIGNERSNIGSNIEADLADNGNKTTKVIKENLTEQDLKKIEKKKQRRLRQVLKKQKIKAERKKQMEEIEANKTEIGNTNPEEKLLNKNQLFKSSDINRKDNYQQKIGQRNKPDMKNKKEKLMDKDDHPRKKPFLPHKMFINGKELEIEYVDGFPIKKEDAARIKKLRKDMISRGLPRSEINIALKLERRKAEKSFTREKKKVCFNCRKSGHNLSECPELNKNQVAQTAGSGICFKCGSTEHTHFECKVVRGQEFRFAQCFICNEQGHIARQCPDNARGLYPKGGGCNVCGDVTHLKKDCPSYQAQQKRDDNLNIGMLGDNNPDVLNPNNDYDQKSVYKRPNKVIKF